MARKLKTKHISEGLIVQTARSSIEEHIFRVEYIATLACVVVNVRVQEPKAACICLGDPVKDSKRWLLHWEMALRRKWKWSMKHDEAWRFRMKMSTGCVRSSVGPPALFPMAQVSSHPCHHTLGAPRPLPHCPTKCESVSTITFHISMYSARDHDISVSNHHWHSICHKFRLSHFDPGSWLYISCFSGRRSSSLMASKMERELETTAMSASKIRTLNEAKIYYGQRRLNSKISDVSQSPLQTYQTCLHVRKWIRFHCRMRSKPFIKASSWRSRQNCSE